MKNVRIRKEQVELILTNKNKSHNWLADRANISKGYLSQIMNGDRYPSGKVREKILKVLKDSTFDEIFEIFSPKDQLN